MITLLKYEWLRRRRLLAGTALAVLLVEGIILLCVRMGGNWNVMAVALTVALTVGGLLLPLLDTVTCYYSDFKRKHGYMLFMTPRTGTRILWAKALFALLELAAVMAAVAGCLYLSGLTVDRLHGGLIAGLMDTLRLQWEQATGSTLPHAPVLLGLSGTLLLEIFAQIAIAMLALTVSRALLPGNSFNWLIALIMYFALAMVVELVDVGVLAAFGLAGDIRLLVSQAADMNRYIAKYVALGAAIYAMWSVACVTLSGRLVNRGVDL